MTTNQTHNYTICKDNVPWSENNAIVARIQDGDTDAYQDLWEANKRLVTHYALHYLSLVERRASIDFDDLIQCGYIGLHIAAEKYDPERGMKFSSYAAFYIKNEMRRCVGIRGKRIPEDTALSLDAPLTYGSDDTRTLGDTIAIEDLFEHIETESLWDAVRIALMRMNDDVIRCILWERYWNKKTNAQTADLYGIPLEEIQGLIQRGYTLMRRDSTLQVWASIYGYAS